jgi:hypothetical protein
VTLIFDTEVYTSKIATILEDPAYRRLDKDYRGCREEDWRPD